MKTQGRKKPRENTPRGWKNITIRKLPRSNKWCIEADVEGLLLRGTKRQAFILGDDKYWYEVVIDNGTAGGTSYAVRGKVSPSLSEFLSAIVPKESRPEKKRSLRIGLATWEQLQKSA